MQQSSALRFLLTGFKPDIFLHMSSSSGHLLKNVLVVYVLKHCDKAGQLVLHLVLRHSLRRLLQEIVTVFGQLDSSEKIN